MDLLEFKSSFINVFELYAQCVCQESIVIEGGLENKNSTLLRHLNFEYNFWAGLSTDFSLLIYIKEFAKKAQQITAKIPFAVSVWL